MLIPLELSHLKFGKVLIAEAMSTKPSRLKDLRYSFNFLSINDKQWSNNNNIPNIVPQIGVTKNGPAFIVYIVL